jgi:hypothetical protein
MVLDLFTLITAGDTISSDDDDDEYQPMHTVKTIKPVYRLALRVWFTFSLAHHLVSVTP